MESDGPSPHPSTNSSNDPIVATVRIIYQNESEMAFVKAAQQDRIARCSTQLAHTLFGQQSSMADPIVIEISVHGSSPPCFDIRALLSFLAIFEYRTGFWNPRALHSRDLIQFCHILRRFHCDPSPLLDAHAVQRLRRDLLLPRMDVKDRMMVGLMLGWDDVLERACNDFVYKWTAEPETIPWEGMPDASGKSTKIELHMTTNSCCADFQIRAVIYTRLQLSDILRTIGVRDLEFHAELQRKIEQGPELNFLLDDWQPDRSISPQNMVDDFSTLLKRYTKQRSITPSVNRHPEGPLHKTRPSGDIGLLIAPLLHESAHRFKRIWSSAYRHEELLHSWIEYAEGALIQVQAHQIFMNGDNLYYQFVNVRFPQNIQQHT
jgi:hypothetical protein